MAKSFSASIDKSNILVPIPQVRRDLCSLNEHMGPHQND